MKTSSFLLRRNSMLLHTTLRKNLLLAAFLQRYGLLMLWGEPSSLPHSLTLPSTCILHTIQIHYISKMKYRTPACLFELNKKQSAFYTVTRSTSALIILLLANTHLVPAQYKSHNLLVFVIFNHLSVDSRRHMGRLNIYPFTSIIQFLLVNDSQTGALRHSSLRALAFVPLRGMKGESQQWDVVQRCTNT